MRLITSLFLTIWSLSSLCGQPLTGFKELQARLSHYDETEIRPVMQIQREKLDEHLSPLQKNTIQQLQNEYQQLQKMKAELGARYQGKPQLYMQVWEQIQVHHQEILNETWLILEAHRPTIDRILFEEVAQNRTQWRQAMNQMVAQFNQQKADSSAPVFQKFGFADYMRPLGFLLWQIQEATPQPAEAGAEGGSLVYPNPTWTQHQLRFQTEAEGEVEITLLDNQGKELAPVLKRHLKAGSHHLTIATDQLSRTVYYYRIQTEDGVDLKRFVKE